MPKKKIFKDISAVLLRVTISALLLFFLFRQVDKKNLFAIIKHAHKPLLLLSFFILFFNYVFLLFRWQMLLKAAKVHLPLKRVIISSAGGHFFNLFLPSTIGGDLVRSIYLSLHTKKPREIVATVLLDRFSGYIGLVIVALLAVLLGWKLIQEKSILLCIAIITAICAALLLILFNPFIYVKINRLLHSPRAGRIRSYIRDLHREMHIFRHHKDIMMDNLILSLLVQIIWPLVNYIIALSLGIKINIAYFFIFIPIVSAITMLPISIGGLGLRDAMTIYFFTKAGMAKDLAFAMSLLSFSFLSIYGIIGGIIYAFTVRHRRIQHHPPHPVHQHT